MILSISQAAAMLCVSRTTLWRLTVAGILPKVRLSQARVGIPEQAITDYIARGGWQSDSTKNDGDGSSSSSKPASASFSAYRKGAPSRRRKRAKHS